MQVQSRACGQLASQTLSIIQLLAFAKHIYPHYMCVSIHINIFSHPALREKHRKMVGEKAFSRIICYLVSY